MKELPHTLKLVTIWLLIGLAVFLSVKWWQHEHAQARFTLSSQAIELRRAADGHFHWPGRLNGAPVEFLIDTGATYTALPQRMAEQLGLERGEPVRSSTAGGVAIGYRTRVDLWLNGGVSAEQLRVTVLPGLEAPLLGMDVLGRLRFTQQDGVLRIEPPQ